MLYKNKWYLAIEIDFLNDWISKCEINYKMIIEDLDKNVKKVFVEFYENHLQTNFDSYLEINEGFTYININKQRITNKTITDIIRDGVFALNKRIFGNK